MDLKLSTLLLNSMGMVGVEPTNLSVSASKTDLYANSSTFPLQDHRVYLLHHNGKSADKRGRTSKGVSPQHS